MEETEATAVSPVDRPLNERRQCVLERRLEGIKAWHVL